MLRASYRSTVAGETSEPKQRLVHVTRGWKNSRPVRLHRSPHFVFFFQLPVESLKCYYVWKTSPGHMVTCHISLSLALSPCDCYRGNRHLLTPGVKSVCTCSRGAVCQGNACQRSLDGSDSPQFHWKALGVAPTQTDGRTSTASERGSLIACHLFRVLAMRSASQTPLQMPARLPGPGTAKTGDPGLATHLARG